MELSKESVEAAANIKSAAVSAPPPPKLLGASAKPGTVSSRAWPWTARRHTFGGAGVRTLGLPNGRTARTLNSRP